MLYLQLNYCFSCFLQHKNLQKSALCHFYQVLVKDLEGD